MLSAAATKALAGGVIAAIYLAVVLWAIRAIRRSPYTPLQCILLGWNMLMARILWRATIEGRIELPPSQGAIIVCNHRSPVDPSFVALATDRLVHWMVAKEYCLHPLLAWFFRTFEAIPVSRGGIDTTATKMAIRYAQQGGVVGLFPEGRLNHTDRLLLPGRPGVAFIALRSRVPVVPCFVSGSPFDGSIFGALMLPAKAYLKVGKPIDLSEFYGREDQREVLEEVTRRLLRAIASLAGEPDYPVELAGRFLRPSLNNGDAGQENSRIG